MNRKKQAGHGRFLGGGCPSGQVDLRGDRQKLITGLAALTGYPRRVCVRFASHMGIEGDRTYREWSEQEIADLKRLHMINTPRVLAAKLKRPEASVRAMFTRLGITLPSKRRQIHQVHACSAASCTP
jgi:hypothetical protein